MISEDKAPNLEPYRILEGQAASKKGALCTMALGTPVHHFFFLLGPGRGRSLQIPLEEKPSVAVPHTKVLMDGVTQKERSFREDGLIAWLAYGPSQR